MKGDAAESTVSVSGLSSQSAAPDEAQRLRMIALS